MLFFLICTLVGVDTLGAVASSGPEGFTWMIFLAIFFFVPYALLTAELGAAFTEEGGQYVWTKLAFGRFVAAVNSVLYWLSNPVWMGGLLCITAVATFNTFFGELGTAGQYFFSLAFIWFGVWAAILSFGIVIFPALIKLRYSHGDVERPYRVPFGMAGVWLCGVLTTFWAVLASVVGLFPGLGDGSLLNDEALPEGFSRGTFQLVVFIPLVVTLATGVIFYMLGRKTREQPPDVPIEETIPPKPAAI